MSEEIDQIPRTQFTLSLGLDRYEWGSRKIRDTVIELGEILIKFESILIPAIMKEYGKDKAKELLTRFNELITGFRYGRPGRPKGGVSEDE